MSDAAALYLVASSETDGSASGLPSFGCVATDGEGLPAVFSIDQVSLVRRLDPRAAEQATGRQAATQAAGAFHA